MRKPASLYFGLLISISVCALCKVLAITWIYKNFSTSEDNEEFMDDNEENLSENSIESEETSSEEEFLKDC